MQGVRLAHPALYPGWVVLGIYLGVYPLLFVALSRVALQQWKWSLVFTIPLIWSGLELIRSYAFTGFSAAMLGHSQVDHRWIIQIGDIGGTYWVSAIVASVSAITVAWVAHRFSPLRMKRPLCTTLTLGALLCTCVSYGYFRSWQSPNQDATSERLMTALLVQRNEPLVFSMDQNREREVFTSYFNASLAGVAAAEATPIDLVCWPESMFTGGEPYRVIDEDFIVPEQVDMPRDEFESLVQQSQQSFQLRGQYLQDSIAAATQSAPPHLLVGSSIYRYGQRAHVHGGAIHFDPQSQIGSWYGKRHLVMFGEYIPFGEIAPWLYDIGPLTMGATPGDRVIVVPVANARIAPSICFETMVEHVTGNGLRQLRHKGESPNIVINLTNDAWFHGTAILDHHRRCSQMVAMMNRVPILMCANQGPTAWIDSDGQVVQSLTRLTNDTMLATPVNDTRTSVYANVGDVPSWPFAVVCLAAATSGIRGRRRARKLAKGEPAKTDAS